MTRPTFRLGPALTLVARTTEGAELAGTARLPPGRVVALVGLAPGPATACLVYVRAWQVSRIADDVVMYRGLVEWTYDDATPAGVDRRDGTVST